MTTDIASKSARPITIKDVAARAGVNRDSVAVVLNGGRSNTKVSEAKRELILQAAQELGYRQNGLARAMVTGRNPVFGFLVADPSQEPRAQLLYGALQEAQANAHFVKVFLWSGEQTIDEVLRACVELRLAGVIVANEETPLGHLHGEMERYGIPVAVVDSCFAQPHGIRVVSDDAGGMGAAVAHLHALGHRSIALLSGSDDGATQARESGFRRAMGELELRVEDSWIVRHHAWSLDAAQTSAARLLKPKKRPTALCCVGDDMAMGAVRVARELGLNVPRDLSVTGFGGVSYATLCDPPLTTVAQPFELMGRRAVQEIVRHNQHLAWDEPESPEATPRATDVVLPTQLLIRASTSSAPALSAPREEKPF